MHEAHGIGLDHDLAQRTVALEFEGYALPPLEERAQEHAPRHGAAQGHGSGRKGGVPGAGLAYGGGGQAGHGAHVGFVGDDAN